MVARLLLACTASMLAAILAGCGGDTTAAPPTPAPVPSMREYMKEDAMMDTLRAFQAIAEANVGPDSPSGTRDRSSPGFNQSVEYIVSSIENMSGGVLKPTRQEYGDKVWKAGTTQQLRQESPEQRTFAAGTEFQELPWSVGRKAMGNLTIVKGTGCNLTADWEGFPEGGIALVAEQPVPLVPPFCLVYHQLIIASQKRASAVIIYTRPGAGLKQQINPFWMSPMPLSFLMPFEVASNMTDNFTLENVAVNMESDSKLADLIVTNIIVDLPGEASDGVLMAGAHLDSVLPGPGINDNGSGSAMLLEVLRAFGQRFGYSGNVAVKHPLRLAWWASEEHGLLGSLHYIQSMSDAEKLQIKGYLNFDMVGSINGKNEINNATAEDSNVDAALFMQKAFEDAFTDLGEKFTLGTTVELGGNSDHYGFRAAGIPSEYIITGTMMMKTEEDVLKFGGEAGKPYDPCIHTACDNTSNIDPKRMLLFGRVAATVMEKLVMDANLAEHLNRTAVTTASANAVGEPQPEAGVDALGLLGQSRSILV